MITILENPAQSVGLKVPSRIFNYNYSNSGVNNFGREEKNDILLSRTHPLYDEKIDDWNLFLDSFKGGKYFSASKYLYTHIVESQLNFENRIERAHYFNYCQPIVNTFQNYIFSVDIIRNYSEETKEWFNNVDGRGTKIDDFMKKICVLSSILGKVYICVELPQTFMKFNSKGEEIAWNYIPIASIVLPQDIVDWSKDEYGNFNWLIRKHNKYNDFDPFSERKEDEFRQLWTKYGWEKYDLESKKIVNSGENKLGIVPFIEVFHHDIELDQIGESMLEDLSKINRSIFNYTSLLDEILYKQTFSQLVAQGNSDELDLVVMGTSSVFNYPKGANPPSYISPDITQANLFLQMIDRCISEMYRLANLKISGHITKEGDYPITAFENALKFMDTNKALSTKADVLAKVEYNLVQLKNRYYLTSQVDKDKKSGSIYAKNYNISTLEEDIKNAIDLTTMDMGNKFWYLMRKSIVTKMFPRLDEKTFLELDSELKTLTSILIEKKIEEFNL